MPYSAGLKQINLYFNRQVSNVSTTYGETFTLYDYCGNALTAPTGWTVTNSSSTPPFKVTLSWTTGYTNQAVRVGIKGSGAFQLVDYQAAALDGEISNPDSGTLPSGNNTAGGDANFRAYALTADTDGDQDVDQADYIRLNACYGAASSCCVPCNLDADSTIGMGDLTGLLGMQSDYWVTSTSDENDNSCSDGDCSLRDALTLVGESSIVAFNVATFSECNNATISLTQPLPELDTDLVHIKATMPRQNVILNGSILSEDEHGLIISGVNNAVQGLTFNQFDAGEYTYGIYVSGEGTIIGGTGSYDGNTITGSGGEGIFVEGNGAIYNTIRGNLIYDNSGVPIGLGSGANGGVLEPVPYCSTTSTISGLASAGAYIDLYSNNETDHDCEVYLGSTTADNGGAWSLTYSSPVTIDHRVVAIQTDTSGNSSEVSSHVVVRDTCSSGIWDDGSDGFSTTLANGDPIDSGYDGNASTGLMTISSEDTIYSISDPGSLYLSRYTPGGMQLYDVDGEDWVESSSGTTYADPVDSQNRATITSYATAIDSANRLYWAYIQKLGGSSYSHVYLSRYINSVETWVGTGWDGDDLTTPVAIDTGSNNDCAKVATVTDSQNRVYVAFLQSDGSKARLYLSRYDGTDVRIWDNGASAWTTTFANGDPVDYGTSVGVSNMAMAVDSQDRVYIAFAQQTGARTRLYLTRYDGTDVKIWDNGASSWTDTFTNGDPIDNGLDKGVVLSNIAIDSQNRVYLAFSQADSINQTHIYLTRYDGSDVKIWDNGASTWTDTFTNGDPIDTNYARPSLILSAAIDSADRVYMTYYQSDGTRNRLYLSRYDGSDVKIWDNGASSWTDTFSNGDPIDSGTTAVANAQVAIDSQDRVYLAFTQTYSTNIHLFLTRYDGQDVKIWDQGATTWTDTFANGDPLDLGVNADVTNPRIIINSDDRVFITFVQTTADSFKHVHMIRY
ncbi:MAG: hypothetical protein HJJLKODD_01114 [Phycisphaerae bacterium]|nr:hypothetical protein [Phycisphaerae bacterium]